MAGTGLYWGAAVTLVIVVAEVTGARAGVYAGAAGGLVLVLIGSWFSGRAMKAEPMAEDGRRNAWSWWGMGLLARLLALVLLAVAYRCFWDASEVAVPVLSMTGVYLAWLFWEVGRLYRRAEVSGNEHG